MSFLPRTGLPGALGFGRRHGRGAARWDGGGAALHLSSEIGGVMSNPITISAPRPGLIQPSSVFDTASVRYLGWTLLLTGTAVTALTGLRWNVAVLAWVAPVPFMLYLRGHGHWRGRGTLLLVLMVAYHLQWAKIVTSPIPATLVPAYALPIAIAAWSLYLAWDAIRRRAGDRWGIYAYPALVALVEVIAYRWSVWGVWPAAATTQTGNLPLLQLTSLTGVSGIGFVMAWVASLTAVLLATARPARYRWDIAGLLVVLLGVFGYGSVRLFAEQTGPTLQVAGVVTDLGPGPDGLPSGDAIARNTEELFERSATAAAGGARLVVWNEAATVVEREAEEAFIARGARLARSSGADLVLAYIVPMQAEPLRFENKYVWLSQHGEALETYFKHHPVPGEGSVRGTDPLRLLERPFGAVAGAICYDYDFPAMALEHARLGAGLVVVPSSDWKGIDPYHTHMARIRAIEGGFSLLRPVRWATSGAFDAYGRTRATLPAFESNDRILRATLPVEPVATLYSRIGDTPVLAYALILLLAGLAARRKRVRA